MTRTQLAYLLGAGVVATGGAIALSTRSLDPGPGGERKTYRALAYTDCAKAKADAGATSVDCVDGQVAVPIEASSDTPMDGYELVPGTEVTIASAALAKPKPVQLTSDCVAGVLRLDVSEKADGSQWVTIPGLSAQCGLSRIECRNKADKAWLKVAAGVAAGDCWPTPAVEILGRDSWRARAKEKRPELVPVEAVKALR